jgi:aldehyde:ferredoxin oxidoreductase
MMDGFEERIVSGRDLGNVDCHWGDTEAALRVIDQVVTGKEGADIFRMGSLRAATTLGKGADRVAHARGMDLPVRDPRCSIDHAVNLALFPAEWDYLRSVSSRDLFPSNGREANEIEAAAPAVEELKVLADITSFCPLVVARFPLISASDIAELTCAATGSDTDASAFMQEVGKTLQMEMRLSEKTSGEKGAAEALANRFFEESSPGCSPLSKDAFERELSRQANRNQETPR